MFDGAFALASFKEGDLVEKGVMRRLPEGFDGNTCPYIFTWSTERPNKVSFIDVLYAYLQPLSVCGDCRFMGCISCVCEIIGMAVC